MRDKIKLESSAGTGHFYTTTKNKTHYARQIGNQKNLIRLPVNMLFTKKPKLK